MIKCFRGYTEGEVDVHVYEHFSSMKKATTMSTICKMLENCLRKLSKTITQYKLQHKIKYCSYVKICHA